MTMIVPSDSRFPKAADQAGQCKQGDLRGRSFDHQFRSFSCLGVLHNAVVAWNIIRIGRLVEQLRAEGRTIDDTTLALTTTLMHKRLNPSLPIQRRASGCKRHADSGPSD